MSDFAKESGHWYDREGNPRYTIIGANGKERPTTLRDGRKLNLFPSYTKIAGVENKPALNVWKENQIALAAITLPRIEGETDDDFLVRVKEDAKEQSRKAADRGTQIHTAIEL